MNEYQPRRPWADDEPDGMYDDLESDRDYLSNNCDLAVRLLDAYGSPDGMARFLRGIMLSNPEMIHVAIQVINDPENPEWA